MILTNDRKQEVYDNIKKAGSRTKFIYAEMKRLGFWDEDELDFAAVEAYFGKEREITKALNELLVQKKKIDDPERLLKEIHAQRKVASKIKQAETKKRKEENRIAKAERWAKIKKEEIIYLGKDHSNTLSELNSNIDQLSANGLEVINEARDLARLMQIDVAELRFLSFSRKNGNINHYIRFTIPKRRGGERVISAPKPRLKKAQRWILENILDKILLHESAQGCVKRRSIKTNAEIHLKQEVVVNQDLKNFFPTIDFKRIRGMFKSLGYSGQLSTILALICSEPMVRQVDVLEKRYYSQRGERFLPQGSPCSPAITNIICRKLDQRLSGLARKFDFNYSRYVDDITFSSGKKGVGNLSKILLYSGKVVVDEGFELHPDKLRIMRKGSSQHVTGILVNEKPNVNKKTLKKFRALIYQVEKDGIANKQWNGSKDLLSSMHGYASFIQQINPTIGDQYKKRVEAILSQHNYKPMNPYKVASIKKESQGGGILDGLFKKVRSIFSKK